MIKIEIDDREVLAAFNRLLAAGGNFKLICQDIGEYSVDSTKRRFPAGVSQDGARWAGLSRFPHACG